VAFEHLAVSWIGDELAIDPANPGSAERSLPGNIADHERSRGADQSHHIRVIFPIRAQNDALHLDLVVPALGKERANRAVDEARSQDFLFRRTSFAFEVAAGEFAGGSGFFSIIDGQGEKILTFFGFRGADGRYDDNGFAQLDSNSTVGLFSDFS